MNQSKAKKRRAPFECQRCNDCCQGRGGIFLEAEEIAPAAALIDLSPEEFIARHCRAREGRYEVLSGEDGACSLMGPEGCRIHQAKPAICRRWPFFPGILANPSAFEDARQACPGIDPEVSHEEFVAFAREQGFSEETAE
ncbi:MAG: YkgJ family cysteine cluster protein [Deltaproteobacteria bacterium]|nr:YkgJ family cysteine cluster protein [Deltaproteobacteria bacterium]